MTDAAGNRSVDPSSGELTIDVTAPMAPTVTAVLTNAAAPVIEGTATMGAGETLSVEVDGRVYTVGDGALADDGDGTWTLTIPAGVLPGDGVHDVSATITDAAGERDGGRHDRRTSSLIDRTATAAPAVTIARGRGRRRDDQRPLSSRATSTCRSRCPPVRARAIG